MSLFSFNRVFLIGRATRTPEKQHINNTDTAYCSFNIAVNKSYKDKNGEYQSKTNFFWVSAYGNVAEQCCKYLKKGSLVHIEGDIDTFEIEKNGEKITRYKINALQIKPLDYKKANAAEPVENTTPISTTADTENNEPFADTADSVKDNIPDPDPDPDPEKFALKNQTEANSNGNFRMDVSM